MVYWLRYDSKTNYYNTVYIIYNTNNKLFYVWKAVTFNQQKLFKVLDGTKDYPLLDIKSQADFKEFVNTMRKDKNFTEV